MKKFFRVKKDISAVDKKLIKIAKRRGRRDGKNGIPRNEWGANSVPYLIQLNKQFTSLREDLKLAFDERLLMRERSNISTLQKDILDKELEIVQKQELELAAQDLNEIQAKVNGGEEEVPLAKFARTRLVGNYLYSIFLAFLVMGEFLITYPALQSLIGEDDVVAVIIAMSVSVLTVATAHMVGTTLKAKLDRSKPQTKLVTVFLSFLIAFVSITVVFLGYIRGANALRSSENLQNLTQTQRLIFLVLFFIFLQLTFIIVGSYLAFMHFSQTEADLLKARRKFAWRRFLFMRNEKAKAKQGQNLANLEIDLKDLIARETDVLNGKIQLLQAQYEEVCAIYRDANIHARKDELDGSHPSLKELPLP